LPRACGRCRHLHRVTSNTRLGVVRLRVSLPHSIDRKDMKPSTIASLPSGSGAATTSFYALAWRWHFYSGLYVVPFLLTLAITGLVMVWFTGFQNRLGQNIHITPPAAVAPVSAQVQAALAAHPGATLKEVVTPKEADLPAWVVLGQGDTTLAVAVDPGTVAVLASVDKSRTVFAWAEKIHGTLLLGDLGDRLIEIAAGLAVVMLVTGLYLWWPRQGRRLGDALKPDHAATGRAWWKSWHASVGFYGSVVLVLFLLTGHAWTGIWGSKMVQPWSSFPAEKFEAPKSGATHASLNPAGLHEVPWGLEQTPLPQSGSSAGAAGIPAGTPVDVDSVHRLGLSLGFTGQFHVAAPQGDQGVYTLSADTMSGDLKVPTHDRTVHIDRNSGRVLADVGYADYSPMAKFMAVGIALHQGDLGWWNAALNIVFCLAIVFLCSSGIVAWWLRRPHGAGRIGAPPAQRQPGLWRTGAVVMLATGAAFPLAGAVLLSAMLIDVVLLSRLPALRKRLS
jgi:uncharacterized iron-regulated membrane protein